MAAMWKRLLQYLRIAVTAVSLLVCVLLIVLWVRSYYSLDNLQNVLDPEYSLQIDSCYGHLFVGGTQFPNNEWWERKSTSLSDGKLEYLRNGSMWIYDSYEMDTDIVYREASVPYWFLVTIFATIAALPWIKWRFSLRTLLIVMTLISLFFGMIAWSMRG